MDQNDRTKQLIHKNEKKYFTDLKDENHYTAYLYAVKYHYKEIADLLRK